MAARKFGIAGFEVAAFANARGAGLSLGFGGRPWQKLVPILKRRGAAAQPHSPGSQQPTGFGGSLSPDAPPLSPAQALQAQVDSTGWYHTIDLGHGVCTPGQFDHRDLLPMYQLPASVAGQRVLDVATFDGFWAFEFERRGAAEVIALDLDKPVDLDFPPKVLAQITDEQRKHRFGRGFEVAKAALQSKVQRVASSVYDLEPARYGMFDIVHAGDFLLHLNSPVRALQRMASVCRGYALISEVYTPELDRAGADQLVEYRGGSNDVTWWRFSLSALKQMVLDAGFERVEIINTFKYGQRGGPRSMHHVVLKAIK
jgi:tRNA (mo5U34)-methyltransferase